MLKIDVIVEIPKNSKIKYEYNIKTNQIYVDRILYGSSCYPLNYGFINNTLDWDGDPLDVLILSDQEFLPGSIVPTRIIGAMDMIDDGETDTKLIGVIDCDPRYNHIKKLNDVSKHTLLEIQDFFSNYKNLQNKKVIVNDFKDEKWAKSVYDECVMLMNKYNSMDKDEFVKKMKKEHPEKYC